MKIHEVHPWLPDFKRAVITGALFKMQDGTPYRERMDLAMSRTAPTVWSFCIISDFIAPLIHIRSRSADDASDRQIGQPPAQPLHLP
jgi:hypothetical protein